jgi:hypothetical protein
MKAMRKELDEPEEGGQLEELREKIETSGMPEKVLEQAKREMNRLEAMPNISPEHGMLQGYLDWLVSVPWKDPEPDPDKPAETKSGRNGWEDLCPLDAGSRAAAGTGLSRGTLPGSSATTNRSRPANSPHVGHLARL